MNTDIKMTMQKFIFYQQLKKLKAHIYLAYCPLTDTQANTSQKAMSQILLTHKCILFSNITTSMFTIQIFDRSTSKPVYSKKVGVIFNDWTRGCAKDQYTDNNGEAHFSEDNGEGHIYVNGNKVFEGRIEGRRIIYI